MLFLLITSCSKNSYAKKNGKPFLQQLEWKKTIHAAIIPSIEVFGKKRKEKNCQLLEYTAKKICFKRGSTSDVLEKNYPENVVAPLEK